MGVGLHQRITTQLIRIMPNRQPFNRRDFLRLAGTSLGAVLLPMHDFEYSTGGFAWPILRLDQLPNQVQEILDRVPEYDDHQGWTPLPDGCRQE